MIRQTHEATYFCRQTAILFKTWLSITMWNNATEIGFTGCIFLFQFLSAIGLDILRCLFSKAHWPFLMGCTCQELWFALRGTADGNAKSS